MKRLNRMSRSLVLAAALLGAGFACARSPAAPGVNNPQASDSQTSVCHRVADTESFVLTVVAATEVPPHMAHGDGYVKDVVPGRPDTRFGPACEFVPMASVTLTFDELTSSNWPPFTAYEAFGMNVKATQRSWVVYTYGNPKPAIIFFINAGESDTVGEVQVTSKDGPFVFSSVDLYSSVTPIPYVITGTNRTVQALSLTGTIPNTFGRFATVSSSGSTAIDTLVIRLAQPTVPCCQNPMGLDNITVRR